MYFHMYNLQYAIHAISSKFEILIMLYNKNVNEIYSFVSFVSPNLRQLFNKCLGNKKFPSQWKKAKIKAIFKKGKKIMKAKL